MYDITYWILMLIVIIGGLVCIFAFLLNTERIFATLIRHQVPWEPSACVLRRAVVDEICTHYPNAKTVVEAGAGFGGMARMIARKCNMRVYAMENMPFCLGMMWIMNKITFAKNVIIVRGDLFKNLDKTRKHFDIGIAYLGPSVNNRFVKYAKKFDVFITLDAPIATLCPTRTVDLSKYGFTRWNNKLWPHKLFIYEFAKNPKI